MVIEPTEEQRQLAQQAMDYGKVMTSATPGGGGTEETLPQEDTEQLVRAPVIWDTGPMSNYSKVHLL